MKTSPLSAEDKSFHPQLPLKKFSVTATARNFFITTHSLEESKRGQLVRVNLFPEKLPNKFARYCKCAIATRDGGECCCQRT